MHMIKTIGAALALTMLAAPAYAANFEVHMLNKGADPNVKDNGGRPPLHSAAAGRDPAVLQVLLNGGADVRHARARLHGVDAAEERLLGDPQQIAHRRRDLAHRHRHRPRADWCRATWYRSTWAPCSTGITVTRR